MNNLLSKLQKITAEIRVIKIDGIAMNLKQVIIMANVRTLVRIQLLRHILNL
jgi:hypothetical protein